MPPTSKARKELYVQACRATKLRKPLDYTIRCRAEDNIASLADAVTPISLSLGKQPNQPSIASLADAVTSISLSLLKQPNQPSIASLADAVTSISLSLGKQPNHPSN
jgi:hypothetical protein